MAIWGFEEGPKKTLFKGLLAKSENVSKLYW